MRKLQYFELNTTNTIFIWVTACHLRVMVGPDTASVEDHWFRMNDFSERCVFFEGVRFPKDRKWHLPRLTRLEQRHMHSSTVSTNAPPHLIPYRPPRMCVSGLKRLCPCVRAPRVCARPVLSPSGMCLQEMTYFSWLSAAEGSFISGAFVWRHWTVSGTPGTGQLDLIV